MTETDRSRINLKKIVAENKRLEYENLIFSLHFQRLSEMVIMTKNLH